MGPKVTSRLTSSQAWDIIGHMTDTEKLDLLKKEELIEIVLDLEKTILKYEDKERHNAKQGKADA